MALPSKISTRSSSHVDPDDSFNDSMHLNDSWFYGPPKKKQAMSPIVAKGGTSGASSREGFKRASLVEKSLGEMETFPKQRLALAKLDESSKIFKNSRVFSFECSKDSRETFISAGERRYLVSTLERFWAWYSSLKERHLYELITESTPCRLYFDLEYSKDTNPNIDHEVAYQFFMNTLKRQLKFEYDMEVEPDKETVLFDSAVYTKNRNFRLYLSSKLGKSTVLMLADYCKFYGSSNPSDRQIFFDSLCVPANAEEFPVLKLLEIKDHEEVKLCQNRVLSVAKMKECSGPSPYPQLDEFMLMIWRKWNQSVYIRQWRSAVNDQGIITSITYYPAKCRFCFNIGREHKSNGTYWNVNLERNDFCQKCFDVECRGISSNLFPLPSFIVNSLHKSGGHLGDSADPNTSDDDGITSFLNESVTELNEFFTKWDEVFEQQ
ncbi:hypothetical protein NECAME_02083 [Necator americanus]|uniref:DNA-directed primase/polymerase protein n=1 Tax=Necator americanus TaxID=51031 RepID=W2TJ45_NECAM|nr:hypothetical protein NECAME_02083 [Necator americanus]ETN81793.1 hypothetical protein NECAME_02083 [Necator americanus]